MTEAISADTAKDDFDLDASDEELLEEFGLLMAAEYYYAPTKNISAFREGGFDSIDGLLKFGISGLALRISPGVLEKRFEMAVEMERRLRG